jgi:hypothetical protein
MLAQLCVSSLIAASGAALIAMPPAIAQGGGIQQPAQRPTMIAGVFMRVVDPVPRHYAQSFVLRTTAKGDMEIELAQTGTVTRNGQPARLVDLREGDQTVVMVMGTSPPMAARVDATGS